MEVFLALGTNLGNKIDNLNMAISAINKLISTEVLAVSKVYETEPFDVLDEQDSYLNCCIKIKTDFSPHVLLGCCLGIEAAMGRLRPFYHASRIIDIDFILCENTKISTKDLTLPHPEFFNRAFVLKPLLDICDEKDKRNFANRLKSLGEDGIKVYSESLNF